MHHNEFTLHLKAKQEYWNEILCDIRNSGVINMHEAPSYLMQHHDLSWSEATEVFKAWVNTSQQKKVRA